MSKHTPGPWGLYITADSSLPSGKWLAINTEGINLPSSAPVVCIVTDVASINERDIANAILIAAAPELLEALKKYEEDWGLVGWGYNPKTREQARAAIAKAEVG